MLKIPQYGPSSNGGLGQNYFVINQESLPEDVDKLIIMMQAERVPIGYWHKVAVRN